MNGRGSSSLKEAIQRRERGGYKRTVVSKLEYMDTMQESLNKEIQASVFPYWRNHPSLKGKIIFYVLVLILAITLRAVVKTAQIQIYASDFNLRSFPYRVDINELSHYSNQSAA